MRWWSTAATQSNKWALRFCSCTFFCPICNTTAAVSAKWSRFFEPFVLRMILIGLICVISVTNLASILEESGCSPVDYEPQSWKEISEGANKIKQVELCLSPLLSENSFFQGLFCASFPPTLTSLPPTWMTGTQSETWAPCACVLLHMCPEASSHPRWQKTQNKLELKNKLGTDGAHCPLPSHRHSHSQTLTPSLKVTFRNANRKKFWLDYMVTVGKDTWDLLQIKSYFYGTLYRHSYGTFTYLIFEDHLNLLYLLL